MKHNGKELTEMTKAQWDGNTREMLVWNDYDAKPRLAVVCGFTLKGNPIADIGNYKKENAHSNHVVFQHCAEIPKEESNQAQNIDEMIKILNAYKEGKIIEHRFRNREMCDSWSCINLQNPDWNWAIFEYRVKQEPRRMTNRELKEWCAEGKGLFKNDYTNAAYTVFGHNVNSDEMNAPVGNWIHIRAWNEDTWHEPMIEV